DRWLKFQSGLNSTRSQTSFVESWGHHQSCCRAGAWGLQSTSIARRADMKHPRSHNTTVARVVLTAISSGSRMVMRCSCGAYKRYGRAMKPLTARDIDTLGELEAATANFMKLDLKDGWVMPMDCGGSNGSHHSYTLHKLAKRGFCD